MGSGYHHSLQLMLVNLQSAWHYVKSPDASASAGPAGGDAWAVTSRPWRPHSQASA